MQSFPYKTPVAPRIFHRLANSFQTRPYAMLLAVGAADDMDAAREALEGGSPRRACDAAWRAASAAAQVGDTATLAQVVELAASLAAAGADAEQLRVYAAACLEDAQKGTRPPSAFERLVGRQRRPR